MAEFDIKMNQMQEDGTMDTYFPIAKSFTLMTDTSIVPVSDRAEYRLYGLVVADYNPTT